MTQLLRTWSSQPDQEDGMTEEHDWIWNEMIGAVHWPEMATARVLDVGCNQGGFLRKLYDRTPFAEGVGVDLAQEAVAMAEARKGTRPLRYVAANRLAEAGTGFDVALSHEVIYLVGDLKDHATQMAEVLAPGAAYHAVTCCHSDNPLWASWRPMIQEFSNLPVPDHSVADISGAFREAGFDVSIGRFLADAFIPMAWSSAYFPTELDRLETYARWKLMFKFTWPG
ncbi:MAG: class I SAM-dependent methyltransferase [Pseudomonadota bacterium]